MRHYNFVLALLALVSTTLVSAQENKQEHIEEDKRSYYEERARQDAAYEQSLAMENEKDEEDFWDDQKQYEKDLKKRDKKAYRAYMQGKRDAYAEHETHCDHHCDHSDHYYHHAAFYYSYHEYHYPRRQSGINTGIPVGTPSLRVGIF